MFNTFDTFYNCVLINTQEYHKLKRFVLITTHCLWVLNCFSQNLLTAHWNKVLMWGLTLFPTTNHYNLKVTNAEKKQPKVWRKRQLQRQLSQNFCENCKRLDLRKMEQIHATKANVARIMANKTTKEMLGYTYFLSFWYMI